jgi:hypothetical protein
MKSLRRGIFVFSFLAFQNAHALEAGILGGVNHWGPSAEIGSASPGGTLSTASVMDSSFGAFVKTGLNPLFDVELDVIYMKKRMVETFGGTAAALGSPTVETSSYLIPVLVRTSFVPGGFFNVGAGAYYEIGTNRGVIKNGTYQSYESQFLKHNDLGLIGSAQVRIPLLPLVHGILDGRYLFGLTEQSTDTTQFSSKNRSFQAFLGLSVGI